MPRRRRSCEDLARRQVAAHGGQAIKSLGDGLMASFRSPLQAVACALAIDAAMTEQRPGLSGEPVRIRMGLHTGMAAEEGGDLFGAAVNAAARIAARAKGDEVLVSEVVRQLCGTLPGVAFEDRGHVRLRGFPQRWHLYRVGRESPSESAAPLPAAEATDGQTAAAPRIHLTGKVTVEADGKLLEGRGFAGRQVRLAFAYLVAHRRSPVPHDELAEVLWPGEPPPAWQRTLSVIASRVRAALAELGLDERVLSSAQGCFHLDLPADTRVDVEEAAAAAERAAADIKRGDWAAAVDHAREAAELTRRPFLPGDEGPWVDEMRGAQRSLLVRALDAGAQAALAAGESVTAVALAEEMVELDPFRETGCRQLIRALAAAGDRARALQAYERCRRLLADELGVSPSADTEAVYLEVLRADRPVSTPPRPAGAGTGRAPLTSSVPIPALLTSRGRIFVGREREIDFLHQRWRCSAAGELLGVVIAGEPGVGKTRLAAEVAARVHAEGATVLAGRCDEDLGVPYQPFVEALRHLVDHTSDDDLGERLGRYGGELVRVAPDVAERVPDLPPPLHSDPETERYRLFDAVAAWLAATSAHQPVLLVLDDLQWATKPTLLLLRHVLRSSEPMRLLVAATYRDTEVGRTHPLSELLADLRRNEGVERIAVSGLHESEVAAFLEQAAGHELGEEKHELARVIHRETEGNAFFVREVVRHLIETGALVQRERRWVTARPVAEMGIPEGVRDVVGRRLSRLSTTANQALSVAAVAGQDFELVVVGHAASLDEDTVVSALDEAVSARLITEVPGPVARHRFAHALVRTTLYEELSTARRAALHRRVAEAIEKLHSGRIDDYLPTLVHHCAKVCAPQGVMYAVRAGDRALAQLAHDEAAAYYRQALQLLDATAHSSDDAQRLELLISLGEAELRGGNPAYRQTLFDAARLAQAEGNGGALARAALANSRGVIGSAIGAVDHERVAVLEAALAVTDESDRATRARLLANLGLELVFVPERDRVTLSDEALALARGLGDAATLAHVLRARWWTIQMADTLVEQWANSGELVAVSDSLGDPAICCQAHFVRARSATEMGDFAEFDRCLGIAERLAAELGQPTLRWIAGWPRVGRLLLSGRIEEAERRALEVLELGRAAGENDARVVFLALLFGIRFEQGRLAEIETLMSEAVARMPGVPGVFAAMFALIHAELDRDDEARLALAGWTASALERIPRDLVRRMTLVLLAMVAAHLRDDARAEVLHRLLVPYADQIEQTAGMVTGSVAHHLGLLATTLGQFDEAEARFGAATATHARIDAPCWLARTRLEWARMLLARRAAGDVERARQLLDQALATARELGLGNVERRAVALLDGLAQR